MQRPHHRLVQTLADKRINGLDGKLTYLEMCNGLELRVHRMNLRCTSRLLLTFTTFGLALFFMLFTPVLRYLPFLDDIAKYTCVFLPDNSECREDVYHFNCAPTHDLIFNDVRLFRHCKARPDSIDGHPDLTHMEAPLPLGPLPNTTYIRTKCHFKLPKLVSFHQDSPCPERDSQRVPNLVHYIWFSNRRIFSFINYVSFVSANKFLCPARILVHGDVLPIGYWWNKMIQELPNVYFVYRERPMLIQGIKPKWIEHEADIVRLQIIYANGGIYLDTDVVVLRSFDPLRKYELTLGEEREAHYSNGIIVAQRHSPFICVWLNSYRQYPKGQHQWNTFSVRYPFLLSFMLDSHLHIEHSYLMKPNYLNAKQKLYNGYFDWSKQLCSSCVAAVQG